MSKLRNILKEEIRSILREDFTSKSGKKIKVEDILKIIEKSFGNLYAVEGEPIGGYSPSIEGKEDFFKDIKEALKKL
jgi:hypothetical protein